MALKRAFNEDERFGLTKEEIKLGEKYLRKHKTAGAIPDVESMKLYELFMVGCSFYEIHQQYPQYELGKIILTAALRKWTHDRERMMGSLKDRVQAKVVKSVIEQVDFLTTMLSVTNVEHMEAMRKYMFDPENNPKPEIRVQNIKEYKEVVDTLSKLVAGAVGAKGNNRSAMFDTLEPSNARKTLPEAQPQSEKEVDAATIISGEIEE